VSGLECMLDDLGSMAGRGRDCFVLCPDRVFSPPDLLIGTAIYIYIYIYIYICLQLKRPRRDTDHSSLI